MLTSPNKNWLWYYKKETEIKISNYNGKCGEAVDTIAKDIVTQLKELDDAITDGVYKSLGLV